VPSGQVLASEQLTWRQTAERSFHPNNHGKMGKASELHRIYEAWGKLCIQLAGPSNAGKVQKTLAKGLTCLGAGVEKCTGRLHGHRADGSIDYLRRGVTSAAIPINGLKYHFIIIGVQVIFIIKSSFYNAICFLRA